MSTPANVPDFNGDHLASPAGDAGGNGFQVDVTHSGVDQGGVGDEDLTLDLVRRVRAEVAEVLSTRARTGGTDHDTALTGVPAGTPALPAGSTACPPGAGDGVDGRREGWDVIAEVLDRHAREAMSRGDLVLDAQAEARVARAVFDQLFGVGGFTPLLENPDIECIDANGADEVFIRTADGTRRRVGPVAGSDAELVELIRMLAARSGIEERRFDRGVPRLSLQLPDGSRMFAVMAVSQRPCVSIRRHRFPTTDLEQLRHLGTVDAGLREVLAAMVVAQKNILIAGGTNLGKTTMLRALAAEIPQSQRLITIEDAYELGLQRDKDAHPDVVALQAREPNIEGQGEVTQSDLVRWALRMSPDRVIVGEIRGPEVIPMCNAMSQGNDGSMATIHASDSRAVFARLAAYAYQAPERLPLEATNLLVAGAVDVIVHLAWADGCRVVSSVREVIDADGPLIVSNEIYRPGPDGRAIPAVPLRSDTLHDLIDAGLDPTFLQRPEGWWDQ